MTLMNGQSGCSKQHPHRAPLAMIQSGSRSGPSTCGTGQPTLDEITEPWDRKEGTYRKMKGTNRDVEIVISISDPSVEGNYITLLQSAYKAIGVKVLDKVDPEVMKSVLTNDVEAKFEGVSITSQPSGLTRSFPCATSLAGMVPMVSGSKTARQQPTAASSLPATSWN